MNYEFVNDASNYYLSYDNTNIVFGYKVTYCRKYIFISIKSE